MPLVWPGDRESYGIRFLFTVILTFLILDLFDTIGTLVGVASEAGLLKEGKLPKAEKALFSDAIGTVIVDKIITEIVAY